MSTFSTSDSMSSEDITRTHSISLFSYLKELAKLRNKTVRKAEYYEKVLWLADVPKEGECYTPAWGDMRIEDEDIWLEIRKPVVKDFPAIPDEIEPWVGEADLANSSDIPELQTSIVVDRAEEHAEDSQIEPETITIESRPHIQQKWEKYLDEKWLAWAAENERVKKVQEVYSSLHGIYQKQKQLGESYETVLGLGLLSWETPSGQEVHRHLVVGQASVELDAMRGTLRVTPGVDGAKLTLEQDMLEAPERPSDDIQKSVEATLSSVGDALWNNSQLSDALEAWINALSSTGTYSGDISIQKEVSKRPRVTFTPALILRRRSERGMITAFEDIIAQLHSGAQIPFGIRRVVEVLDDDLPQTGDPASTSTTSDFQEILFPLPSNEEQNKIVETINSRQGVVVQGPPGTGKSHTIANLICHLLSAGNRVLVTSQTPRALKVLKGMIPKEMTALCVSLLGNDTTSLKELEDSVYGITNKQHDWDSRKNSQQVSDLRNTLESLKKTEANLSRRLREVREKETYEVEICDGAYRGTAQAIAKQIAGERPIYDWLKVKKDAGDTLPIDNEEAIRLLHMHRELTKARASECRKDLILSSKLPTVEEFVRHCGLEREAKRYFEDLKGLSNGDLVERLKHVTIEQLEVLRSVLTRFLNARSTVFQRSDIWVPKVVDQVLREQDRSWQEMLDLSRKYLNGLIEWARRSDDRNISDQSGLDRYIMLARANDLLQHFRSGGNLGIPMFRPKPVKDGWKIIKEVFVNGRACDNVEVIKELIEHINTEERLNKLWALWTPLTGRGEGKASMQARQIEDLCETLELALNLLPLMKEAREAFSRVEGLLQPAWYVVEDVEKYQKAIAVVAAERALSNACRFFEKNEETISIGLSASDPHLLLSELQHAISDRDEVSYGRDLVELENLQRDRVRLEERGGLQRKLASFAPDVASQIEVDPNNHSWDEKLGRLSQSWTWNRASRWLEEYIGGADEAAFVSDLQKTQEEIRSTTSQLAAASAWRHAFGRLNESQRRHLIAWTLAVKKVGKGKGKYAETHRKAARENMEHCKNAIPAWIMPLYRVAETVKPGADAFDVVIIDEASQSGPDASLLQFLAKKMIIVGDDQQISPDNIGIPPEHVNLLQKKYLKELPMASREALDLNSSFFDMGRVLFPGRIVLREHFRCMPEIIQFSNGLCYSHSPLEPLRQYPPERLQPVIHFHVKDGYREGGSQAARNLPEAEAIVEKISECCKDPKYDCPVDDKHPYGKKTIGVISLLGEYQAHLIEEMLLEEIEAEEFEERNIVCGDAYAFQGDERDIIFLSMVAAPGETTMAALVKESDKRRFNVAASRARDQMWLFHTPSLNDFRNKECFRYRLLNYCIDPKVQQADGVRDKCTDDFEREVYDRIVARGYKVIPQFEVAGYYIDLVVEDGQRRLAVECDGDRWHSTVEQRDNDMRRQRILERCGWTFWRVRGSSFYYNPDKSLESLWGTLSEYKIAPVREERTYLSEKRATVTSRGSRTRYRGVRDVAAPHSMDSRLDWALEWSKSRFPGRTEINSELIQDAIVALLTDIPNHTCTKDSISSRVSKHLGYQTRGQDRIDFQKQVYRAVNRLKSKGIIEEYVSTRSQIRLIEPGQSGQHHEDILEK